MPASRDDPLEWTRFRSPGGHRCLERAVAGQEERGSPGTAPASGLGAKRGGVAWRRGREGEERTQDRRWRPEPCSAPLRGPPNAQGKKLIRGVFSAEIK